MKLNESLVERPVNLIRQMFAHTDNGKLTMEPEDGPDYYYLLDWDKETSEILAVRCKNLLCDLEALAEEHDRWMESTEGMPEDLRKVWNTYILPYPDHGMDAEVLFDISMKEELDEPLTEKEKELLERQRQWMRGHALTRLPFNRCNPAGLIQRARRYEKLRHLGAPKIVLNNEACCLAEELVLYYCMVQ